MLSLTIFGFMLLSIDIALACAAWIVDIIFILTIYACVKMAIKTRKKHALIESKGIRVPGKIIDFKSKVSDYGDADIPEYWLVVEYVDVLGDTKHFDTPMLSFRPEERNDVTCDVYIYGDDILATNYRNLVKKK